MWVGAEFRVDALFTGSVGWLGESELAGGETHAASHEVVGW